jgi:hypothetical protein
MATLVLGLPVASGSNVDSYTIYDSPGYHPFTYRKITPTDNDLAIYLEASL